MYAAPPPLPRGSEALSGHHRSSYVIKGNHGSSFAIRGHSEPLGGHSVGPSEAISRARQRPSEVLSGSSEVIRGTQRHSEVIGDHSEALRGTQWHSAALRGTQRGLATRSSPPLALRSASKHPVPHIRPTHFIAHPPHLIATVFHAQRGRAGGQLPLHLAARNSSSVAVVQALLAANPEAAMATDNVRRPLPPISAWMRGPERSS
jgi:hypothetical protein